MSCWLIMSNQKANLPILIRARCYMLLSTKHGPLGVQYAEAAVSLLDNEARQLVVPEAFPTEQFELAQKLLRRAKERDGDKVATPDTSRLEEAASSLPSLAQKHGLVTQGASRSASGKSSYSGNRSVGVVDFAILPSIRLMWHIDNAT